METINVNNYEAFLLDYIEGNLKEELCEELKLFALTHPELEIDLEEKNLPSFEAEIIKADFTADLKKTELDFPDELLLSYLENNLSEEEREAVEVKLRNDNELAFDLEQYKKTILKPDSAFSFSERTTLLKNEDDFVLNNRLLAYFENTLSETERTEFASELNANISLQKELLLVSGTRLNPDPSEIYPGKETLKKQTKVIVLFNFRSVAAVAAAILLITTLSFVFNYYNSNGRIDALAHTKSLKKDFHFIPNDSISGKSLKPLLQNENELVMKERHVAQIKQLRIEKISPSSAPVAKIPDPETENIGSDKDKPSERQINNPEKNPLAEITSTNTTTTSTAALAESSNSSLTDNIVERQSVVKVLEGADNDPDEVIQQSNGFWKKIVKLAKRANQLGVKSIDGVENPNERFSLSLNAFRVERH